jgi:phospholipase C
MNPVGFRRSSLRRKLLACAAIGALVGNTPAFAGDLAAPEPIANLAPTATPIKHVIIIIGENRSFDHVFATYKPVNPGEKALNLRSKGIVNDDGSPGPNYGAALQYSAYDSATRGYRLTPLKAPYATLPPALVCGTSTPYGCEFLGITTGTSFVTPANIAAMEQIENGLDPAYY